MNRYQHHHLTAGKPSRFILTPIIALLTGSLLVATAAAAPQIVRPGADGTLADGGVYGPFDGAADNWDWTFNQSSYEGAITLATDPGSTSLEQRVVWEYNLSGVTIQPPATAILNFTLRGATVYPMADAVVQVFAYSADLVEASADYSAGPAVLQGSVVVPAFQSPTAFSINVSAAVNDALAGNRKVAFRFQAAPAGPATISQAFVDAADSDVTSKPYLSIDAGSAGVPAAVMSTAVSRKPNAGASGGFCDVTLLPARKSEPRTSGISELRIGFNMTPGVPEGSGVTLESATCAASTFLPYTGASVTTSMVAGNELVLSFNPALENARTYRITLGPSLTTVTGQVIEVRGLVGDVDSSGQVNSVDRSLIVGFWTGSGFSCETDLDSSSRTNAVDRGLLVGAWTGTQNCAP